MAIEARSADAAQPERTSTEPNWWKQMTTRSRLAVAVFLLAVFVAAVLILVGSIWASGDVALEAAKAGLQLLAVALLGGAVAAAFRWLDADRDEQRRLDDYRSARVGELWDVYHQIKAVRRALRAAGFAATSGRLTDEQIAVFRTRMVELNDAQLSLEKLLKLIDGQDDVFGRECGSITEGISQAERYVGHIITAWENSQAIQAGADLGEIRIQSAHEKLGDLWPFLEGASAGGFKSQVSKPIRDAATKIQSLRISAIRTDVPELSDEDEN